MFMVVSLKAYKRGRDSPVGALKKKKVLRFEVLPESFS